MQAFVDSDGMTDREVQRLGWADDAEPSSRARTQIRRGRPGVAADPKPPQTWSADTVWGAAARAHRMNLGEYVKEPVYKVDSHGFPTGEVLRPRNRVLMDEALRDTAHITAEDRELGQRARDYISKALLVKAIKNTLSEFDLAVQRAVAITEFDQRNSRMEMAVIASQIRAYEQAVQLEEAMEGIHRDALADIGAKVDIDVTVVKSVFSQNYGVFFITAVTPSRHAVFFSYRDRLSNGHQCRVRGTVKAHRENSTQLNRVRIV
jgi:hypothetical protein